MMNWILVGLFLIAPTALYAGGADGGGGDSDASQPLNERELKAIVERLPLYLRGVLNFQELLAKDEFQNPNNSRSMIFKKFPDNATKENLAKAHAKIFSDQRRSDVFAVLEKTKFKLSESCVNLNGEERDATAFNSDPNEICLNKNRILSKTSLDSAVPEILALAAHEISHKMGTTEPEADALQWSVKLVLGNKDRRSLEGGLSDFQRHELSTDFLDLDRLLAPNSSAEKVEVCIKLAMMEKNFSEITKSLKKNGASNFRYKEMQAIYAGHNQIRNMLGYCKKESFGWVDFPASITASGKVLPIKEFLGGYQQGFDEGVALYSSSGLATYNRPNDLKALHFNAKEFQKNLIIIENSRDLELELFNRELQRKKGSATLNLELGDKSSANTESPSETENESEEE